MGQCYSQVSMIEREEISRGLALGHSVRAIGYVLGQVLQNPHRDPS